MASFACLAALAGCLPVAAGGAETAQPIETRTAVPAQTGEIATAGPTRSPEILPEETEMPPVETPADRGQAMAEMARAHLAKQLNIGADQISVVEVKPVVWTEGSLGCPKPNIDYMRMDIPGFRIQLQYGDTIYTYHTDQTRRVVRCER